jgi:predicted transposase YbfD/YdcC
MSVIASDPASSAGIAALLGMLAIEGAIVTVDAMGCQRDIAAKILAKKADYVLALKGNQGTLREDVELFATEQKANGFQGYKGQPTRNGRRRPWAHRDQNLYGIS